MDKSIFHGSIALMITLGLSFFAALEIDGFLGISFKDKELLEISAAMDLLKAKEPDPSDSSHALPLRIADFGSVGVIPDAENWGNDYSHNLRHLQKAIMPNPPYIDRAPFDQVESEFKVYVDLLADNGINGLIVPFLLEFINFDRVEGGNAIYGEDDNFRHRHLVLRKNFKRLFEYARQKGIDIFLYSDMVILTPPLEAYLVKKIGSLIIQGIQLTLLGAVSHVATLEKFLTAINDELAVLPGGLSRILGITTLLNIPTTIPAHLLYVGLGMVGASILIMLLSRRKSGDKD